MFYQNILLGTADISTVSVVFIFLWKWSIHLWCVHNAYATEIFSLPAKKKYYCFWLLWSMILWKYQSATDPQWIRFQFFSTIAQWCMWIEKVLDKKSVPPKMRVPNMVHAPPKGINIVILLRPGRPYYDRNTFKAHLRIGAPKLWL